MVSISDKQLPSIHWLCTAIRYQNWQLHTGSLKLMAPVFEALDRQKLIPHLKDFASMPNDVLQHLKAGGFGVRLSTNRWCAVALDECHEMKINKDAKLAIVRPSEKKMEIISHHIEFRARCVENLQSQTHLKRTTATTFSYKRRKQDEKIASNIKAMQESISKHGMFHEESANQGLWNFLDNIQASPEVSHDMLALRIGQTAFETYVSSKLLQDASTQASTRKKCLCTF